MICDKILGNIKDRDTDKTLRRVRLEWFERKKKLLRKTLDDGEEIGIRCAEPLSDGDIIFEDGASLVVVCVMPCDLIETRVDTMREMGRLCLELGNRHLPVAIEDGGAKCPYDAPTLEYLRKRGFSSRKIRACFDGYIECAAHSHEGHDHAH